MLMIFPLIYLHSLLIFMTFLSVTLNDNNPLAETESNFANYIRLLHSITLNHFALLAYN